MSGVAYPEIRYVVPPIHVDGSPIGTAPRMRHLVDCDHFEWGGGERLGNPVLATPEQMETLPACKTCIARQFGTETSHGPREGLIGEACPRCHFAMPLTGVRDNCG